jgi:hypothetical protein
MRIPHLIKAICDCGEAAEQDLRKFIETAAWGKGEAFITDYFLAELRQRVKEASESGLIEAALRQDVEQELSMLHPIDLQSFVSGIRARVTIHNNAKEAISGGDIGIVLVRPDRISSDNNSVTFGYKPSGLLCQAKLGRPSGKRSRIKWGEFTDHQKLISPERLEYLALLLYKYSDIKLQKITNFSWQICKGFSFDDIERFSRTNSFPSLHVSSEIIEFLGAGIIGTSDKEVIKTYIEPVVDYYAVIDIGWPEKPDGLKVLQLVPLQHEEKIRISIRN